MEFGETEFNGTEFNKTEFNIETPAVVVDMEKLRRNIKEMQDIADRYGCNLRPHIKTHKIPLIAKLQLEAGAVGITCAKISEAEVMADAGIDDIFIAYPIIGESKIKRASKLNKWIKLTAGVDSIEGARALAREGVESGKPFRVRLEVDTGLKRTGVPYEKAVDVAKELSSMKGIELCGIFTFKSLNLGKGTTGDREAAGLEEGKLMKGLAEKMRAEGLNIEEISGGSTPTGQFAAMSGGLTEIRPGTYVFYDMMGVKLGAVDMDRCAAAVLVTVVSVPEPGRAIIDGGSKTFATDFALNSPPYFFEGYASVVGNDDLVLERVNEEHGMLKSKAGKTGLKVGDKLLLIPNHICTTVNLHDFVYLKDGDRLEKVDVSARGKLY